MTPLPSQVSLFARIFLYLIHDISHLPYFVFFIPFLNSSSLTFFFSPFFPYSIQFFSFQGSRSLLFPPISVHAVPVFLVVPPITPSKQCFCCEFLWETSPLAAILFFLFFLSSDFSFIPFVFFLKLFHQLLCIF